MLYDPKWESKIAPDSKIRSVLIAARKMIENKKNWHQGGYARDADGEQCHWTNEHAVAFCMMGAVRRSLPARQKDCDGPREAIEAQIRPLRVGEFNDSHTHAEVLAVFDRAIAAG